MTVPSATSLVVSTPGFGCGTSCESAKLDATSKLDDLETCTKGDKCVVVNPAARDYPGNEASFGTINRANDLFRRLQHGRISLDDMRDIPKDIARVKGTLGREAP